MSTEHTLSIIKPDAVSKNIIGVIINRFEVSGIVLVSAKMMQLKFMQALNFYSEHKGKLFFNDLINFMISGPVLILVLEGDNVIQRVREIIGHTNPLQALAGTIRSDFGENCTKNAIHGSDSLESAKYEIAYFFNKDSDGII